jgi:hypothetical protein
MGKAVIGIIGLVIGAVLGIVFGAPLMMGTAAGLGVASGLNAGICATVQAAQDEGLLSAEQVDQVLTRAASDIAAVQGLELEEDILGSLAHCEKVMADLAEAARK